jgi:SAM-dependent methyltransferase
MARDTQDEAYAERLSTLSGSKWKRMLDVQRPYRWNMRRLHLGRVLDVGCGIGRNLGALPGAVGVDHNPWSIEQARAQGYTAWTSDEWAACTDAVPGTFDAMLLAHVLEHMGEQVADEVIRTYLPFLKPDATLVFICPQERGYDSDATHVRFLDLEDMARHAVAAGFTPIRLYSFPFPRGTGKYFTYNESVVVSHRRS